MFARKITASLAVLAATAAVSAPAFADRGHYRDHYRGYGNGHRVVVQRPAVVHRYYRPAPRPAYVVERPRYDGVALLAGAVIGAAIVHHAITGGY